MPVTAAIAAALAAVGPITFSGMHPLPRVVRVVRQTIEPGVTPVMPAGATTASTAS